ncbi:MFS family permease [Staphylococcus pasteuri]|uniref:Predicted arabinose efflux permease, MFS family n=2 Tax=Staphylococcus TaxID=1279 RepID=A0ABY1H152_9STAP|nr:MULTISPECIES: MFS transporter [Staphylococcus]ATH62038.1 multidrug MFS transporter [Staphylococcus pasteuri]MCF7600224.1 MFS transporter [Staphylococcus pasteuri]MDI3231585.1 MFS transporter [Staphylococcus pasteuri]MDO6574333.1 MFS transporter [Staphylococcus pasteuri_A]MEB6209832.1 MFS transporter [Staphylococcus pasteuri]
MSETSSNKAPIFTKRFNLNFIINFFVYLCMYLLIVVIAGYSKSEYHASDSLAGLVVGLFIVGSLIGRFGTGKYVNTFGPKRILMFGLFCLVITQALYFIPGNIYFLMFVRLINGIATAIATTATGTIAAYVTPQTRKSEGISLFSLSLVLGTAVGPFFGILLLNTFSITLLFTLCIVLGILGLILSFFINIDFNPTNKEQNSTNSNGFSIHNFIAKEAVPVAIVMLLVGVTYAAILTYLQAFAEQRDLVSAASYFFIFYAVASLVTRPIAGRLMDSKNENVVVYPSFIALILSFICLMFSFNSGLLLLSGVLLGIGYGNLSSSMQAISIKVSPSFKYGLATSTYFIGLDVGIGFGPSFLGLFTHMISYSQIYGAMAILGILTTIVYFFVHGKKVKNTYSYE